MAKRSLLSILFLSIAIIFIGSSLLQVRADSVSQSYNANLVIPTGSLVALQPGSANQIVIANSDNNEDLLGVSATPQSSLINLNSNGGNTQVVTAGSATVLVSDINGDIVSGDSLTTSPIAGVAMKATAPGKVVGVATGNFSSQNASERQQITDKDGKTNTVAIGSVNANIMVANFQNQPTLTGNGVISAVQAVAVSTSGKSISTARALLALLVLIVSVVISILILYTAVASSIRSIGRNPLSRHSILQSLIQVVIAVIVIMLSGFSIVYLIIGR
jgi:hypothetical protein